MRAPIFVSLYFLCCSAWSQSSLPPFPAISGYVTRVESASNFDVNGVRIFCRPDTKIELPAGKGGPFVAIALGCPTDQPVVGQPMDVYGNRNKKANALTADRLDITPISHDDVSGDAVIDAVSGPHNQASGAMRIRCDGYHMLLSPRAQVELESPLLGLQDVTTNVWMKYEAKWRPDGVFVLTRAKFHPFAITDREDALRAKTEYDPSSVPANARPSRAAVSMGLGVNPQRIPPWSDQEQQKKLKAIGEKLIPAWQKNLADSDPARINFRFQLTDGKKWPYVLALPSGIILVPHQVVEKMQNDSQLAEILADALACVIEKQTHQPGSAHKAVTAGMITSLSAFIPVVGAPASMAGSLTMNRELAMLVREQHQSARVSLDLLHDAGYDVDEAPKAWWLLGSRKVKPIEQIAMPDRAAYLYEILGQFWSGQS